MLTNIEMVIRASNRMEGTDRGPDGGSVVDETNAVHQASTSTLESYESSMVVAKMLLLEDAPTIVLKGGIRKLWHETIQNNPCI